MEQPINLSVLIEAPDQARCQVRAAAFMLALNDALDQQGVRLVSLEADERVEEVCLQTLCIDR